MRKITINDCEKFYYHYRKIYVTNKRNDYLGVGEVFPFDTLSNLYIKKDQILFNLFNYLSDDCLLYKLACEDAINGFYERKQQFYIFKNVVNIELLLPPSEENVLEWFNQCNRLVLEKIESSSVNTQKIYLIVFLYINLRNRLNFEQNEIDKIYGDCLDYGLIPVNEKIIIKGEDSKILIDKEKHISIKLDIDPNLVNLFYSLKKEKLIETFSIRGNDNYIYEGEFQKSALLEALGTGKYYDLNIDKNPKITMLYSDNYDDQLIVNVDNGSIVFEELYNNKNIISDYIITNVIHLTYIKNSENKLYITHLDQEYIFYKENEFEDRKKLKMIKGTARKPFKTFKLNNCKIPFDYVCDDIKIISNNAVPIKINILYYILNRCFVHKDLLDEYFSNI